MKVLVAMSGGVDSSVAAALLADAGHDVVGVTLKLWGGPSDQGCCSVADVDDARRVADRLGIDHHVFNFTDDFEARVVTPYVEAHARGETPNPCVECNRHLKFDRLTDRAAALGFDAVATGHHARVAVAPDGTRRLRRGADPAKDQSYVLYMLGGMTADGSATGCGGVLQRLLLPVGDLTKAEVRARATALGLRTADKADSQDVCFIRSDPGRAGFLSDRLELRPGRVVDRAGTPLGQVAAVQLVTIGQRRGLGTRGGTTPRYVLDVDVDAAVVTVGERAELAVDSQILRDLRWAVGPEEGAVLAQTSAHGRPRPATVAPGGDGRAALRWLEPQRRVAPGQAVVLYRDDLVLGGGLAA
jgi:tRNA-specific 2-thiouridylase